MIIQVFLTLACLFFVFYGLGQFQHSRIAGYIIVVTASSSGWFVWHPGDSTFIANFLGIGRGTDLLLYLWFVVSASLILVLHIKMRRQERQITKIARHIAIYEADHFLNTKHDN